MEYKSLRDFAIEKNVTVRTLQRHIKKHESDLEKHIIRRGPPVGTSIDEYAQEYLSGLIVGHPLAIQDATLTAKVAELETEIHSLQAMIIALQNERNELTQRALTAESKKELADAAMDTLKAQLEHETNRADTAEEIADKLKNRSLWERITRRYEA